MEMTLEVEYKEYLRDWEMTFKSCAVFVAMMFLVFIVTAIYPVYNQLNALLTILILLFGCIIIMLMAEMRCNEIQATIEAMPTSNESQD